MAVPSSYQRPPEAPGRAAVGPEQHVLLARQVGEEDVALVHPGYTQHGHLVFRPAGDIRAFVENLSGARGEDARKHVEDSALAGSVWADYAQYLALIDGQADVVGGD